MNRTNKRQTEDDVLDDFRQVHGNRYQYLPFPEDFKATSPIDIVCVLHGKFSQRIHHHKLGKEGCPECLKEKRRRITFPDFSLGKEEWIKRFEEVHGRGKYDYSRIGDYVVQKTKMKIYCPEHDTTFFQTPERHWRFKRGCPKCGRAKIAAVMKLKLISRREYEIRARIIHGDRFEYSELLDRFSQNDNIIIYCNHHKQIFFCTAMNHLKGETCPLCKQASLS